MTALGSMLIEKGVEKGIEKGEKKKAIYNVPYNEDKLRRRDPYL